MTRSNSAGKAPAQPTPRAIELPPAQPTPRAIELQPIWDHERYEDERRGLLDAYLKIIPKVATLYSNSALRQEILRVTSDIEVLIKHESKEFEEAWDAIERLDEMTGHDRACGFGKLPAGIVNVLTEAPGVTKRRMVG
jgi:hypothetical protein